MKKLLYCLAVVVAVAVMVSCDKDPEKTTEPKDIAFVEYSLEGTDAEWTNYLRDNEIWENTIIVIDSDEELREYVSGDYPEVDFTEKTLLLAGGWAGEVEPQDHKIYKFSDRYELTINLVLLSLSDYEAEWKSAVIVDKLLAESRVELEVTRSATKTRSVGSSEYYYYRGRKIPLTRDNSYVNVVIDDELQKSATPRIVKRAVLASEYSDVMSSLQEDESVRLVLPFFSRGEGADPIGTSDIFHLKLKSAEDIAMLEKMADELGVRVIEEIPYTPLWYTLSILGSDFDSSIEASNYFYETGLFEDVDPAFMFDFQEDADPSLFGQMWGLQNLNYPGIDINVMDAWNITRGNGVYVAVTERGIDYSHRDLDANIDLSKSYDAVTGSTTYVYQSSAGSHGTHVTGIIAAEANNLDVVGVAPKSKIMAIRVELTVSQYSSSQMASGINWAWQNGADVINNSWSDQGGLYYNLMHSAVLESAILNAMNQGRGSKGSIVVFVSGNEGENMGYPGNFHRDILTVGGIQQNGLVRSTSGYGPMLDVVAPGTDILSTVPGNRTGVYEGTSAAAPHVSGVAALMLSANPNLTAKQVSDIIESTAQKVGGYNYATTSGRPNGTWHEEMGYGLVDAYVAVNTAITPTPPAPSLVSSGSLLSATEASWAGFYAGEPVYWITPTATSATVTVDSGANFDSSATYEWRFDPRLSVRYSMPYYIGFYIPALGNGAYPRRASYRVECRASKNGQYSAWSSLGLFVSDAKPTGPYRAPINVDSLKTTPPPVDVR